MGLFGKKEHAELSIILDIRSASIGGAFVELHAQSAPTVLFTTRQKNFSKEHRDPKEFISVMYKTLASVLETLQTDGARAIGQKIKHTIPVYVVYSSPWFMSQTKSIRLKKTKPFIFTEDMFKKIISKETLFQKEEGVEKIESDITHVVVNGYELKDPYEKKINEIDIAFYLSAISSQTKETIEKTIKEVFNTPHIIHRTNTLVTFSTLRHVFSHTPNFLFIEIGGEVTDVGIVEQNTLTHSITVPVGYHEFVRALQNDMKMDETQARSTIETLTSRDEEKNKKTYEVLDKVAKTWSDTLISAMEEVVFPLPQNIFVISESENQTYFNRMIKRVFLGHETSEKLHFNVISTSQEYNDELFIYAKNADRDTFIESQVIFLDSLIKSNL